jgi:DNA-directed RNA polymerase
MTSNYQLKQEQERLERDSIHRGIERYVSNQERDERLGRGMDNPVADRVIRRVVRKLIPAMAALQERGLQHNREVVAKGGAEYCWGWHVNLVSPEALAYVTVKTLVATPYGDAPLQNHVVRIGHMVQCEYWWNEARKLERQRAKDTGEFNRLDMLKRTVREVNPKAIRRWMRKLEDLSIQAWSRRDRAHVGAALMEVALPLMTDILELKVERTKSGSVHRMLSRVSFRQEFLELLHEQHMAAAVLRPWVLPMVIPPTKWSMQDGELVGGYRTLDARHHLLFIRGYEDHTAMVDVPVDVLNAVNVMQSVPWEVNSSVLDYVRVAFEKDQGPLPYEPQMPMPPKLDKDEWEALTADERKVVRAIRARTYDHNNHHHYKKQTALRALLVADEFEKYERIYFPHSIDFRGRAYPIPQDLHPQGSDMIKAMLRFAEGKPLGERGLVWLECHVANCYGLDKHDRTTQQMWTELHWDDIQAVAEDPWDNLKFWMQAEEPWLFLAAAIELAAAAKLEDPTEYVSHLPVSLDGSCNGLQHLSAMGRDPVGAKAVNLLPGERQDVYQIVADKVNQAVPSDNPWYGHVTRKTVKRGVMTTPYGVTPRGIATQLKQDGFTRSLEGDELANANYLRAQMVEAIDETIVVGKQIMAWMQECATTAAAQGQGVSWTTPIGLKVTQRYSRPKSAQLRTCLGKLTFQDGGLDRPINKQKQKTSVAPNVIHSFDAAHMMMVASAMPEGTALAMVHDSFGTHACDVDELLEVTKQTFVHIYRENWFEALWADFRFFSDHVDMPEPPKLGDFDIEQVLQSQYFFS